MERGARNYWKKLLFFALLSGVVFGSQVLLERYWPTLHEIAKSGAVFFAAKGFGDGLHLLFYPTSTPMFGEDFIRELVVFSSVGLVAGVAGQLAQDLIGGQVEPALPALAGYLVYGFTTRRV